MVIDGDLMTTILCELCVFVSESRATTNRPDSPQ